MNDQDANADRLIEVFNQAKIQPPGDQRRQFLAEACHGDASLCAKVEELLGAHDAAGSFLNGDQVVSTQLEAEFARLKPEEAGDRIGHYKLLQQIGEGGFGTVWMAEQSEPVKRRVALKIIKLGMDTKEVVARFEQERQALAMMDHPNIARVFDAGATPTGRPFFVMELVRGIKITEYCDEQALSTHERIGLFIGVCHAVQHAHQKGIIHRDLKPSNILVTINDGEAVPKVIDFGVAKATQGHLSDATLFTKFEQMIGTPLYMSPEQAEMTSLDIDTRSDIYSLGVLLYELLTGKTPIDTSTMARAGMDEIRRIIRDVDPPKPSARLKTLDGNELTTAAKRRHTDAARLPRSLRGDIDWIVMKCLEKDRKRRYDTANGIAADLQRHLRNESVIARPPTAAYLLGKLIKRNKLAFAAAAAIAASLAAGMAATVWQLVQTRQAEQRVVATLDELRKTAPAFAEQARALAAKEQYEEAIQKLNYAIELRPDAAEYYVAKADLLQCQLSPLKLTEAGAVYRQALRIEPGLSRAEASAKLCDELLAAKSGENGKLTRESLAKLHLAMQQQQRPAAELMPVARLLGDEKKLLVDYWAARLKDLPVAGEKPLEKRLTVQDDGRLAIDLSWTKVVDVSPLAGAPLAVLNLAGCAEVTDISPLRGLPLTALNLSGTSVHDLSPLAEMHALENLNISDSHVTDLSPVKALRLKTLSASRCAISDLTPIRGMPVEELTLYETRVADITPLSGMPIKILDLSMSPVLDFAPLATLPLEKCYLQRNRITDLSVFRGKPLKELVLLGCGEARNFSVLSEIPTLELLLLPTEYRRLPWEDYSAIGALRKHPKLRQIGAEVMGGMHYSSTGPKDVFWQDWDREQKFVLALRERNIAFGVRKLATGTYSLGMENQNALTNLSVIKGAPISVLNIPRCKFTDLSPLRGMPLRILQMSENEVSDLSPLQGMPLEDLYLRQTKVTDLTPLAGMPLKRLFLDGCTGITDVKVLGTIETLQHLTIPPGAANIESLRSLPNLRKLGYDVEAAAYHPITTVEQFWKEYDEQGWLKQLRASGFPPQFVNRHSDGTWEVRLNEAAIVDLRILSGAPISRLWLGKTGVTDLTPLRGMALKELKLDNTKVTDLAPLAGMALETLDISGTKVADISVTRGMPLTFFRLHSCKELTDLSLLREMKTLSTLTLPPNAKAFEFLRALPNLKHLSFTEAPKGNDPSQTAEEFWKSYESLQWYYVLRKRGIQVELPKQEPDGTWSARCTDPKFADLAVFRGARISSLYLRGTAISDLSALRELPLTSLSLFQTGAADLRPLENMALRSLDIRSTQVADLAPLRSPPLRDALKELRIYKSKVTDFSPIADLKNLEVLDVSACAIDSLEIVRGRKLRYLHMMQSNVRDLSILAGMPLEELQLNDTPVTDLRPLLTCPTLKRIVLPAGAENVEALRALPGLVAISYEWQNDGTPKHTAAEFWKEFEQSRWLKALQESATKPNKLNQLADRTWHLDLMGLPIQDLQLLKGAPISELQIGNTAVADLRPLSGMALKRLWIYGTKVTDLRPLAGMPLEAVAISGTAVRDISVFRGMPIKVLKMHRCKQLTDLSPLADMQELKELTIPEEAQNFEFLRMLPKLERLSYWETTSKGGPPNKTVEEFWKEYDAQKAAGSVNLDRPGSR